MDALTFLLSLALTIWGAVITFAILNCMKTLDAILDRIYGIHALLYNQNKVLYEMKSYLEALTIQGGEGTDPNFQKRRMKNADVDFQGT